MKPAEFTAEADTQLLPLLIEKFPDQSRTTIKSWLTHRLVSVNDITVTLHSTPLHPADRVRVAIGERGSAAFRHPLMRILHEDQHIVVIDKREGLLSMGTLKEQRRTAFYILSEHLKRSDPSARLFILHRLDRETSGLMVFAKSQQVQETMQRGWKELVRERRYVAVAEGIAAQDEGTIDAPLADNKARVVYVCDEGEGQDAVTRYRVLRRGSGRTLLDLGLETGRKNQIRAHLRHVGLPIAGDVKYGGHECSAGRVCLHAYKLHITHPATGAQMDFDLPVPPSFERLVK